MYEYETFFLLNLVLQCFVFISSVFSVGVYYVVINDFYDVEWKRKLFSIDCCIVIFIILETGSMAMVTYFIEFLISKYGTTNDIHILNYNNSIKSLTELPENDTHEMVNICKVIDSKRQDKVLDLEEAVDDNKQVGYDRNTIIQILSSSSDKNGDNNSIDSCDFEVGIINDTYESKV